MVSVLGAGSSSWPCDMPFCEPADGAEAHLAQVTHLKKITLIFVFKTVVRITCDISILGAQ